VAIGIRVEGTAFLGLKKALLAILAERVTAATRIAIFSDY